MKKNPTGVSCANHHGVSCAILFSMKKFLSEYMLISFKHLSSVVNFKCILDKLPFFFLQNSLYWVLCVPPEFKSYIIGTKTWL